MSIPLMADAHRRRSIAGISGIVLAILCVFPRYYEATVALAPPGLNSAGLGAILGQLGGNFAALINSGQSPEINIAIAHGYGLERRVAAQLSGMGYTRFADPGTAERRLDREMEIRTLRGGIFEFRTINSDPVLAQRLVSTYATAFQRRLAELGQEQTDYKHRVLDARMKDASERLVRAQTALENFRSANKLAAPDIQLSSAVGQLAGLQANLQAKKVELQSALAFATPQNVKVRALQAEINSLQGQITQVQVQSSVQGNLTVTGIAQKQDTYINLQRDVQFSQSLYEAYSRYLEGVAVEDMSNNWNVQVIEPAYIDPGLYIKETPLALLILLALMVLTSEIYVLSAPRKEF